MIQSRRDAIAEAPSRHLDGRRNFLSNGRPFGGTEVDLMPLTEKATITSVLRGCSLRASR